MKRLLISAFIAAFIAGCAAPSQPDLILGNGFASQNGRSVGASIMGGAKSMSDCEAKVREALKSAPTDDGIQYSGGCAAVYMVTP
jgi:hypothetical protein